MGTKKISNFKTDEVLKKADFKFDGYFDEEDKGIIAGFLNLEDKKNPKLLPLYLDGFGNKASEKLSEYPHIYYSVKNRTFLSIKKLSTTELKDYIDFSFEDKKEKEKTTKIYGVDDFLEMLLKVLI